ncbi:DUF4209 domain-containing protein [Candidatus Micrarchaeota archaeon]|nr:DUF4209 domain-containing protein [Candidatus Micrarchaeota archaeon]
MKIIDKELGEVLVGLDKLELEEYFPYEKEKLLGEAAKTFDLAHNQQDLDLIRLERMLLNNTIALGVGVISDKWAYISTSDKINQKFSFWKYDQLAVDYFKERLEMQIPPLAQARISFYLWTATKNFDYAIAAINKFMEAIYSHAVTPGFEFQRTSFEVGKFMLHFLKCLNRKSDLKASYLLLCEKIVEEIRNKEPGSIWLRNWIQTTLTLYVYLWPDFSDLEKESALKLINFCESKADGCVSAKEFDGAIQWEVLVEHFGKETRSQDLFEKARRNHLSFLIAKAEALPVSILKSSAYESAIRYMNLNAIRDEKIGVNLMPDFERASEASKIEFKEVRTSVEIPQASVDQELERICGSTTGTALLELLAEYLIPSKSQVEKQANLSEGSLAYILPTVIQYAGHTSAPITSLEDKHRLEMLKSASLILQFNTVILQGAMEKYKITDATFKTEIDESNIGDNSKSLLKYGVEKHFSGDYVSSNHVLVLQIEELMRQEVRRRGKSTSKFSSDDSAINLKLLGELVSTQEIIAVFGEDFCHAIGAYYSNPRNHNLRNRLGHGVMEISDFNRINSLVTLFVIVFILSKTKETI